MEIRRGRWAEARGDKRIDAGCVRVGGFVRDVVRRLVGARERQ